MVPFVRSFIIPLARKRGWKSFCEIGASFGTSTDELLKLPIASYVIIDPCFDADLASKYSADKRVTVLKSNSLDALSSNALPLPSGPFDCILIDGDHNWYTVINELRFIHKRGLLRAGGFVFFHDVFWPYGRRDMYYQPDTIPAEFRHPYARKGIIRGQSQLAESGGRNGEYDNALHEGGPRNGVLTAIEDFIAEHPSDYGFCSVRLQYGLGILQSRRKPGAEISFLPTRLKAASFRFFGNTARGRAIRGR